MPSEIKLFPLNDKALMSCYFQFLVTGEMVASQIIFELIKKAMVRKAK
jgi:hypothetical protein